MKKKLLSMFLLLTLMALAITGCKKKEVEEEPEGPTDEILTAVSLNDLQPGNFYVKNGESFYLMPYEDSNFDLSKLPESTDKTQNGIMSADVDRLLDFIYKDQAIPTLYKNDQLIYVSTSNITSFTWERFYEIGYSVGASGLQLANSGKITTSKDTIYSRDSSLQNIMNSIQLSADTDLVFDSINGTALSSQYLTDGGIISGMSRDAVAIIDLYAGTQHVDVTAMADTRYFKSFEVYSTSRYTLSPDGYAVIEIPNYLRSGYYFINNIGFVKYLNIDRGNDESGIVLTTPYYYIDENNKVLTYYEYQESLGLEVENESVTSNTTQLNVEDYDERMLLSTDASSESITVTVAYRYSSNVYESEANQTGNFPRVVLLTPEGQVISLEQDDRRTNSSDNRENYTYLSASLTGAVSGDYYLLFSNFENIYKIVETDVSTGNADSYLHNGQTGNISHYYDASDTPHLLVVTWDKTDRAASEVKITDPEGNEYSMAKTPDNVIENNFGRYSIMVPNLIAGTYRYDIKGDQLGRVRISVEDYAQQDEGDWYSEELFFNEETGEWEVLTPEPPVDEGTGEVPAE